MQLGVNRSYNDKLLPSGSFRTTIKEVKRRVEIETQRHRLRTVCLSLNPKPQTLNLNPKPQTLNPKP